MLRLLRVLRFREVVTVENLKNFLKNNLPGISLVYARAFRYTRDILGYQCNLSLAIPWIDQMHVCTPYVYPFSFRDIPYLVSTHKRYPKYNF